MDKKYSNDNYNYYSDTMIITTTLLLRRFLIYLPNLRNVAIDENVLDVPDVVVVEVD